MSTDLFSRIRAADDATTPTAPALTDDQVTSALDSIVGGATAADVVPLRRPRRRRTLAVAATVALLAGGLVAAPYGLEVANREGSHLSLTPNGASAQAGELLEQAARITPSDPATHPGQYWHVVSKSVQVSANLVDNPKEFARSETTRVDWFPVDGRGHTYTTQRERVLRTGRSTPARDGRDVWAFPAPTPREVSFSTPTPAFLAALPRDTTALRAALYKAAGTIGNSRDGEALTLIGDALRSGIVPADLRAALFRVAATIPGVEVTDRAVVLDGRRGVAFGRLETKNDTRDELVIDPTTGTLIGERTVIGNTITVDSNVAGSEKSHVLYEVAITRELVNTVPRDVRKRAKVQVNGD